MQDGGKVLGFPAEWSRALRLSPIVCMVDTLGVLFSIAFFWYKTGSVKDGFYLAARYRCLTEDDPAEPKLERTWWFRLSVFALGALPQAVKLLGMGGIPVTKMCGMAYLVSFLVLEGLDLLQPRQRGDDHALEQHAAVLDDYICLPSCPAVYTQAICFVAEALVIPIAYLNHRCDLEPSNCVPLLEPFNLTDAITVLIKITPYWLLVQLSPFVVNRAINLRYERAFRPSGREDDLEVFEMFVLLPIAATGVGLGVRNRICLSAIETAALAFLMIFLVWVVIGTEQVFKVRWIRKLLRLQYHERKEGYFPLFFTAGNIAGIMCYYRYMYDPFSTYKPPWTEYLG